MYYAREGVYEAEKMNTVYLLFDGESIDGTGTPAFLRATENKEEAIEHLRECRKSQYCYGRIQILTEKSLVTVRHPKEVT